jgi:hypothetical protein
MLPCLSNIASTVFEHYHILNIGKSEGIEKGIEKGKREEQQTIARSLRQLGVCRQPLSPKQQT